MRIPFADPNEAHTGQRVCVGNTRELRRARALGQVPVLASGWEGSSWLAELAHGDAVLLVTIDGDRAGVFFVPSSSLPPAAADEPPGAALWAVTWRDGGVREEPATRPRTFMAAGDRGPHLALHWEPGALIDLDPQTGGICYLVPGAEYRRFCGGRGMTP